VLATSLEFSDLARLEVAPLTGYGLRLSKCEVTVFRTNPTNHVEIITSVQRRRRWIVSKKVRMVEETVEQEMTMIAGAAWLRTGVHMAPIGGA
jgi:hypothetical protein